MILREFQSILLGQNILICTDHKNLESELAYLASQIELRQRLLIEEFGITIKYIKDINNTVADTLSQLEFTPKKSDTLETINFLFSLITAEDTDLFPLSMAEIADQQVIDDQLIKRM